MPETVTFERPTAEEAAADRLGSARRVFAEQFEPDAAPGRLAELIAATEKRLELERARLHLLRALEQEPDWRTALLGCNVPLIHDPNDTVLGGGEIKDGVDQAEAKLILARAAERVKAEGGPEIKYPDSLLALFRPTR